MLDRLPREVLLDVFEFGGLPFLTGGPADTCTSLREVSRDRALWKRALAEKFVLARFFDRDVESIPDYRAWYVEQVAIGKVLKQRLEVLVHAALNPSVISAAAAGKAAVAVLRHRLRVLPELDGYLKESKSLAHHYWTVWLRDVLLRMEGVQRLLELSTRSNWGNEPVAIPTEYVIALLFLRCDVFHTTFMDLVYNIEWKERFESASGRTVEESSISQLVDWTTEQVNQASSTSLARKTDFFSVMVKSTLFAHIMGNHLKADVKLLCFPMSTYCCILDEDGEFSFVDFAREGRLRSVQDIQNRLELTNTPRDQVRYGISLYDLLATTYVWHTMPSIANRKSVLDLIEHAAMDVRIYKSKIFPALYSGLVKWAIAKSVWDVEKLSSGYVEEPETENSSENIFEVGMVCRLRGVPPGPEQCVILEAAADSCSVLRGSEILRVLPSMLMPGYDGKIITRAGLTLPDIEGLNMLLLGEHFMHYDVRTQMFTNAH